MPAMQSSDSVPAHLSLAERLAVREFVSAVGALFGPDLYEIRLFGSRARGEGNEESDIDLALIVTGVGRSRRREAYDLAYDIGMRHGVLLAPLVIERTRLDELRQRERLIAMDLDREGIRLS